MHTTNTISVTVDHANNARMLAEWLKNIRFVKEVKIEIDRPLRGNAEVVQKVLDSKKSKNLFADIIDPVAWQKELRDEVEIFFPAR
jgi:hypothetical protein